MRSAIGMREAMNAVTESCRRPGRGEAARAERVANDRFADCMVRSSVVTLITALQTAASA